MFIDSTEVKGNQEIFNYKCRNPQCAEYGYKKEEEAQ